jgi:hypothetical protein
MKGIQTPGGSEDISRLRELPDRRYYDVRPGGPLELPGGETESEAPAGAKRHFFITGGSRHRLNSNKPPACIIPHLDRAFDLHCLPPS